jgi:hypothetical protein
MTQQHPITPPPELVEQWMQVHTTKYELARQAAQWGADRQLKADAEWLDRNSLDAPHLTITPIGKGLVEAMRSKLPSLKEQALKALASAPGPDYPSVMTVLNADQPALIRRALE